MSIRFAPAMGSSCHLPGLLRGRTAGLWLRRCAANDNAAGAGSAVFDPVLVAALRHFARDGIKAGRSAEAAALQALAAGDKAGFAHWLSLARMLDRPRARRAAQRATGAAD
jgi:hypothetical protein